MIPLSLKIKREVHRKTAFAQDIMIEDVYKVFERAVFHGGTAIWRCYQGKRFSEDLDFYFPKDNEKINSIFTSLEKKGFIIIKKKIAENSMYSELEINRTRVRLEATYQNIIGHIMDYETCDGNLMSVYSLIPEEFIKEKVNAYLKRLKVRDLYDIFFLLKLVKNWQAITDSIKTLLKDYKPPVDEKDLGAIIIEGIVPSVKEMVEYVKRKWENANIKIT